jgi:hypothetical protein
LVFAATRTARAASLLLIKITAREAMILVHELTARTLGGLIGRSETIKQIIPRVLQPENGRASTKMPAETATPR